MAAVLGLVQGGVQSLSRSMYGRLVPEGKSAEFFGFYNMVGKFGTVLGPALMGVRGAADRQHARFYPRAAAAVRGRWPAAVARAIREQRVHATQLSWPRARPQLRSEAQLQVAGRRIRGSVRRTPGRSRLARRVTARGGIDRDSHAAAFPAAGQIAATAWQAHRTAPDVARLRVAHITHSPQMTAEAASSSARPR